ncbi:MAG: DNA recombination protein RmuC [Gemmatimonadota bacterium]|nr:DNA recombination protein RmuC [Gemmatimonadota bacterium]
MNPNFALIALAGLLLLVQVVILLRMRSSTPGQIDAKLGAFSDSQERSERSVKDEIARSRTESAAAAATLRSELQTSFRAGNESMLGALAGITEAQSKQLTEFSARIADLQRTNEKKLEAVQQAVTEKLAAIQKDNAEQLDRMRQTVDEKLQKTLETRLGESFKLVSDSLDQVQRGLGEMRALGTGVDDLRKVLTNVKTRGTWGEVQLGSLLEQVLSPDQYLMNVATRQGSSDRVEFAVKFPGGGSKGVEHVLLPIDAKFPNEDYQRLIEASERGDADLVEAASKALETRIKNCAKDIREKYIDPPHTTDIAILFLPTEGLYAEVLRRIGLCECLQRDYRVSVAGPTTLLALLNTFQMGFRTLALEKRASEVWTVLGGVKTEFTKFGDVLDKLKRNIDTASNTLDRAATRTRAITRKLKAVEETTPLDLPVPVPDVESELVLPLPADPS